MPQFQIALDSALLFWDGVSRVLDFVRNRTVTGLQAVQSARRLRDFAYWLPTFVDHRFRGLVCFGSGFFCFRLASYRPFSRWVFSLMRVWLRSEFRRRTSPSAEATALSALSFFPLPALPQSAVFGLSWGRVSASYFVWLPATPLPVCISYLIPLSCA